ncbi:hypothetical protein SRHO_G00038940 [Serrasalmus rhombeus]
MVVTSLAKTRTNIFQNPGHYHTTTTLILQHEEVGKQQPLYGQRLFSRLSALAVEDRRANSFLKGAAGPMLLFLRHDERFRAHLVQRGREPPVFFSSTRNKRPTSHGVIRRLSACVLLESNRTVRGLGEELNQAKLLRVLFSFLHLLFLSPFFVFDPNLTEATRRVESTPFFQLLREAHHSHVSGHSHEGQHGQQQHCLYFPGSQICGTT